MFRNIFNFKMKDQTTLALLLLAGLVVFVLSVGSTAHAGTSGLEWKPAYDLIVGWVDGYLGKALAVLAFVVGLIAGIAKSSPMLAGIGILFAIIIVVGPGIINGMITAVV